MFCFRESEVEVWACNFPLVLILRDSKQLCLKTGHADCRDLSEEELLGPPGRQLGLKPESGSVYSVWDLEGGEGEAKSIPEGMSLPNLAAICKSAPTCLLLEMGRVGMKPQSRVINHRPSCGQQRGLELPVWALPFSHC